MSVTMDLQTEAAHLIRAEQLRKGQGQYTDTSNAELIVRKSGGEAKYCAPWKKWVLWDGKRWESDERNRIYDIAKTVIRSMHEDVLNLPDHRDRIEMENHAIKSEAVRRRKAAVEAASWEPSVNLVPDDLDRDPWLFNVRNGTIDLKTGSCREHRKEDLISKVSRVDFDPHAGCPTWLAFLREITDCRADLMEFLQIAAGWTMTGDISAQTMFILYGSGANGKSTYLNALIDVMGDYAISTPTETFMHKHGDQMSNDIARLRGTRLVTTMEAEQGKKLSEPLIKQVTGNDRLTARFLYGEYFDFRPTFKIYMATNHKPIIHGTDFGIWRRIKLIPFTVTIPNEKQDPQLQGKLHEEASGIMNWMIEGCLKWRGKGLVAPAEISEATDEYRGEMDGLGTFLHERCIQGPGTRIRARELFKTYQEWCEEVNERAFSERMFGMRMQEIGVERYRTQDARYWKGIELKAQRD